MTHGPLAAVLLVFAVGLPLVLAMHRLRVGALTAYLLTGAVLGTIGRLVPDFGVASPATLQPLAEIGASMLLFALGLEFDLHGLRRRLRPVLIASAAQIGLTCAVGLGVGVLLGLPFAYAFGLGCCLTMASTLFVLRGLDERGLRSRNEGQLAVGLCLVQDVMIAPMLLAISLVVPGAGGRSPWAVAVGMAAFAAGTWWFRNMLAGLLIDRIRALKVPEVEVAFAVTVALGAAWLSDLAGLGTALGAFCAGLALGGTEHRATIEAHTRPLQGLMAIVFFSAMGMLFDPGYVAAHPFTVAVALAVALVVKALIAAFAFRLAGMAPRTALGAGLLLGSIGEFSFVIAAAAFAGATDVQGQELYRLLIAITCLGLALTPLLTTVAVRFLPASAIEQVTSHGETIVVAGLGPVGAATVRALMAMGQNLLLVDRNPRLLDGWRGQDGIICHQGRIEDMDDWLPVLGHRPALVVLTFPIADTSAAVARRLTAIDPGLVVVARSPYERQIDLLSAAGVRHVICDERETALALLPVLEAALTEAGRDHRRLRSTNVTLQRIPPAPTDPAVDNPRSVT